MQHDDLVWGLIGKGFCSFRTIFEETKVCRNEYNLNGLCSPQTCPLANSRYATVREQDGKCVLMVKVPERAHTPLKMWQQIQLPTDYIEGLKKIDQNLQYWPEFMLHKIKQRYTVIFQYLLKIKKVKSKTKMLVPISKRIERRENTREEKALKGANIEKATMKKLLERIKEGNYDEIYNFDEDLFAQISGKENEEVNIEVEKYVEDEEADKLSVPDIEDAPLLAKRKMNMVMNIDQPKRLRHRH